MISSEIYTDQEQAAISKLRSFGSLLKFRLSFLVAFSSGFGYLLGTSSFNWFTFAMLFLGGLLISGSASGINQILEIKYDALMKRTKTRALPTGVLSKAEAVVFVTLVGIVGLVLLWIFTNPLTTGLSLVSLLLYAFVYTPLKRVGSIAVFVGAIPGALPPLLGWVAATGMLGHEAFILFGIQFIWQFPHFWAIAWVADEDYQKAGFRLLPQGGKRDINTAFQIMVYTLFLIPMALLPAYFGITGITSALIATVCGVLFLIQTFYLMKESRPGKMENGRKAAFQLMFGSFLYLPIVQIAFIVDRI